MKSRYLGGVEALCTPGASRDKILVRMLEDENLPIVSLTLEERNHYYVPANGIRPETRQIFTAHHDRYPGSPGANDNGAAVSALVAYAGLCSRRQKNQPAGFLFTDGEEITEGEPLSSQGAYQLGKLLREKGLDGAIFTVFDMCGIGDTPVVSFSGPWDTGSNGVARTRIRDLLREFSAGQLFEIPFLPSDTLGFSLAGYPTLVISLLPFPQARDFAAAGGRGVPAAWQSAHTAADAPSRLEDRAFRLMGRLLPRLSALF